jgi:Cyclic GMP-AMP synthase DncV-like, nucleotidyltransferase domain
MTTAAPTPAVNDDSSTRLWTILSDELDVPRSLYEKAARRHTSLGEWLCRPESSLARFQPRVRPQGSFRYGTVTKPIIEGTSYDLDQIVLLEALSSTDLSQADLKARFGNELAAYARAHQMQAPEEKHRCWRLPYRDDVAFHLDSVPSVRAGAGTYVSLRAAGVAEPWAVRAVSITDDRHPQFNVVGGEWPTSNPRGFARWFESQAAMGHDVGVRRGGQVSVESVPSYEWRTPLQRSIQLLKRHRDVMFLCNPELAPISMIITNLAAHAYEGEADLATALCGIVDRMGDFVRDTWPRVPNPTHPQEDYADKWRLRPELETNFWRWLEQARGTVHGLAVPSLDPRAVERRFQLRLTPEQERRLAPHASAAVSAPMIVTSATPARVDRVPRPWGQ